MKRLLLFLFLTSTFVFANKKNTSSKLKDVTVFLNGAQIIRTASIQLQSGTTEIIIGELSSNIDESSIQFSGLKNASILSVNYGINFLTKQKNTLEIEGLQHKIKALNDEIQGEEHLIHGYNEEMYVIQNNRSLGNENQIVSLEKLQQLATYYRQRITEIRASIYASNKRKEELSKEIFDINNQLREYNVEEKVQTGEIKLRLNSSSVTDLNLIITYNVTKAGWFPIYDLKADNVNSPLQLTYKAHVYQNTGNDWKNVKLTLSTSDPKTNNIKPDVNPKYLNFVSANSYYNNRAVKRNSYNYNPTVKTVSGVVVSSADGLPLPAVNVMVKGTSNGIQTDFDGRYTIKVEEGNELVYSFLGMQQEVLPIHSSVMNITLDDDVNALSEVVISGYSTKQHSQSIDNMLQGIAAGVQVSHHGKAEFIRVRGNSSINAGIEPLYVVDGKLLSQNNVNDINPDMVESVSVLKDAASTSIYGARGANGVVLITTKQGEFTTHGDFIDEGITNINFEIKKAYDITSNEDITVIEIDKYFLPATYYYFAAPLLNENVFLTAKIENFEKYNLLPAEANIYFEGSYSGKTHINPQTSTNQLTISLGLDPNVVVTRTQPRDFKKKTFIGSNKIISKHYLIELKNNKSNDIDLVLYDRIPISQNKEIKVDDIETGSSEYDDKKGVLKWKVNLKSNTKQTYEFSYTLKYPKYKHVNL